jgi:DASH complex subunit SPC19
MSRQSVWPSAPPPSDHLHYLEDCISATEHCVTSLTSTLDKFRPGIQDFPRLNRILVNEHVRLFPAFIRSPGIVLDRYRRATAIMINDGYPRADFQKFLVLPQTTISTHLSSTSSLLSPEITKLLKRAEQLVEAERTKLNGIEKTINILQSASIPPPSSRSTKPDEGDDEEGIWNDKLDGIELRGLDIVQVKKIRMLRNKRERLEKERVKLGLA